MQKILRQPYLIIIIIIIIINIILIMINIIIMHLTRVCGSYELRSSPNSKTLWYKYLSNS